MSRWLLGNDKPITEPNIVLLSAEEARCTPDGQVMHLEGARSTYDLNRDFEKELAARRKQLWETTPRADLLDQVRRIAGMRTLAELPEPQVEAARTSKADGLRIQKVARHAGGGAVICRRWCSIRRQNSSGNAVLYLHENGKEADAGPGGPIEKLVQSGRMVVAVDLRGIGRDAVERRLGRRPVRPRHEGRSSPRICWAARTSACAPRTS